MEKRNLSSKERAIWRDTVISEGLVRGDSYRQLGVLLDYDRFRVKSSVSNLVRKCGATSHLGLVLKCAAEQPELAAEIGTRNAEALRDDPRLWLVKPLIRLMLASTSDVKQKTYAGRLYVAERTLSRHCVQLATDMQCSHLSWMIAAQLHIAREHGFVIPE